MHVYEMSSRKQKRVVRATLTAEGNGAVDTLETGKLIQLALEELLTGPKSLRSLLTLEQRSGDTTFAVPAELSVDARSLFDAISATEVKIPTEDSFVLVLLLIREALVRGRLRRIWWVATEDMLADCLTKGAISRNALVTTLRDCVWNVTKPAKSFGPICKSDDFGKNGLLNEQLADDNDHDRIFVVTSAVGARLHL